MASKFGIITIADLEGFACRDFSTYVNGSSVRTFSDTNIEAWISQAEKSVRKITGIAYDSTASDDVKQVVIYVAYQYALEKLVEFKFVDPVDVKILSKEELKKYIQSELGTESKVGEVVDVVGVDDYT